MSCAAVLAVACGGSDVVDAEDAGADASVVDGTSRDSGSPPDARMPGEDAADSSVPDSERPDSNEKADAADAGPRPGDAEADVHDADARPVDSGAEDVGSGDADARGADADATPADGDATLPDADGATRDSGSVAIDSASNDVGTADADGGLRDAAAEATFDAEAAVLDAEAGPVEAEAGEAGADILASARKFAILAGSTISITPSPPMTTIIGDVGVSPGTAIATLPPGQPVGNVFAGGPVAAQAQSDLTTAYNNLAGMPCLPANNRTGVDLGGKTLAPAVYCFPNTSAGITGDLVLDAQGDPNAVWVFQVGSTLTTATTSTVSVINGGSACNVYWQIGSSATLGTGTVFAGNIVALTSVTLVTGSTIMVGRALARNGAVTMDGNTVSAAACQ